MMESNKTLVSVLALIIVGIVFLVNIGTNGARYEEEQITERLKLCVNARGEYNKLITPADNHNNVRTSYTCVIK